MQANNSKLILVAGATGYVGGRLVPLMLERPLIEGSLYPVRHLIFSRMVRRIAERAEETG